jgi:GNAT superfamily N-acetyltransferase
MIRQPWQPPYYARCLEEAGLGKRADLLMWELHITDREHMLPVLFDLAEGAERDHGVRLSRMTRRSLRRDLDVFAGVYNRAWRKFWYFTPYDKADLDAYALEMQLVFDPDWFMIAEIDSEPVAIAITVPDVNQALRRMNGRLLPFGWWHFVTKKRYIDRVRVGFLGVKPEFQHTGVAARLYVEHFDTSARTPIKGGEMGWILETNEPMNRAMEAMNGRVVKRYRVFEREL